MRILLLIFISIHFAFSQGDPLFKIVSYSEGVLLDGIPVKPGQFVYPTSLKLEIPKRGYAVVITKEGYAGKLIRGMKIKSVNESVEYYKRERPKLTSPGGHQAPIDLVGNPNHQESDILNDSIFLAISDRTVVGSPYFITFKNLFEEVIFSDTIKTNWAIYYLPSIIKDEIGLLCYITTPIEDKNFYYFDNPKLIRRVDLKSNDKIEIYFKGVRSYNEIDLAALYEINGFIYDHLFQLYKIKRNNLKLDYVAKAYFERRVEKYQLDNYNISANND